MPRHKRLLSEANIYHIVLKGINSQQLFFDDSDYLCFLKLFSNSCKSYDTKILAYCLMNNHIHLLLKFGSDDFSTLFKSFGAAYVPCYNKKYKRTGPLFNGRFYSKPINDDAYLYAVLKYIHYNPVKAGICNSLTEYKWCSYREYNSDSFCFADDSYLFSLITKKEFDLIHITDESDFISFFTIEYSFEKSTDKLEEFILRMKEDGLDCSDIVQNCLNSGVSLRKLSSILNMDIRSINAMRTEQ